MHKCNEARLKESIVAFSRFGATEKGGITRLSLSSEDIEARNFFIECCKELGMDLQLDDLGNIYETLPGKRNLPPIVMGSHLDSVIKGGKFDGVLGVLTALEVVRTIKENNIELDVPLTIVNFTNEEGARFEPSMMSSGVLSGKFEKAKMLKSTDKENVSLEEALERSGFKGSEENRLKEASAYIELHIEQGPVLEAENIQIGIVEGVLGMVCYEIRVLGESNHAGTTPMKLRKDPLFLSNNCITMLIEELGKVDEELVYTIGRMDITPNIPTVIPSKVVFSIEARHKDPAIMLKVEEIIHSLPQMEGGCRIVKEKLWGRDTVIFDEEICNQIERASRCYGYSSKRLYSGAGHDAQFMASYIPSAMIFVPSINGKSHCEEEETTFEDCVNGANVLLKTVLNLQVGAATKEAYI